LHEVLPASAVAGCFPVFPPASVFAGFKPDFGDFAAGVFANTGMTFVCKMLIPAS
jgi:hypothetical protein